MAAAAQRDAIRAAARWLQRAEVSINDFLAVLLEDDTHNATPLAQEFISDPNGVLTLLVLNKDTQESTEKWILEMAGELYRRQVESLTKKDAGYHFMA